MNRKAAKEREPTVECSVINETQMTPKLAREQGQKEKYLGQRRVNHTSARR